MSRVRIQVAWASLVVTNWVIGDELIGHWCPGQFTTCIYAQDAKATTAPAAAQPQLPNSAESESKLSTAEVQRLLEQHRSEANLPAMWAGKFYPDGRSVQACVGVRKRGSETKVEMNDKIHLGSCTKAMTAVMATQLISAGKLRWDTRLAEVFPDEEGIDESPWGQVTVQQLMRHESGVPANAPWGRIHLQNPRDAVAARRAVLRWLLNQKRPQSPKFLYSNLGFCLLGHIAEHIEGKNWQDIITNRVFTPIGIQATGFGPVIGEQPQSQPWGHSQSALLSRAWSAITGAKPEFSPVRLDNLAPLGPAGRAHMPMQEWAKFVSLFSAPDAPDPRLNISADDWKRLLSTSETGTYGGGWISAERAWGGGRVLNHAGSNTTWFCVAWVAPNKGFSVLVAANAFSQDVPKACDQVAYKLLTSGE